jgi:hypothetical protein
MKFLPVAPAIISITVASSASVASSRIIDCSARTGG